MNLCNTVEHLLKNNQELVAKIAKNQFVHIKMHGLLLNSWTYNIVFNIFVHFYNFAEHFLFANLRNSLQECLQYVRIKGDPLIQTYVSFEKLKKKKFQLPCL